MATLRKIVHEEAQAGLVWVALGAIGWTAIITATELRFFGSGLVEQGVIIAILSLLTGLPMTLPNIGVRLVTGKDLSTLRPGEPLFRVLAGALLGGFISIYLILAWGFSPLILALYGVVSVPIVWLTGRRIE